MMKYSCVLFDLDGTLLDTGVGLMAAIADTIAAFGLPEPDAETLRAFVGPPISVSLKNAFGLDDDTTARATAYFRRVYPEKHLLGAEEYAGIHELLRDLRKAGVKLGVATNKPHSYTLPLMAHFGFDKEFDVIQGSVPGEFEGKALVVTEGLRRLGVTDKAQVALVGDTVHDQKGAEEFGIDFVAVDYGYGYRPGDTAADAKAVAMCHTCAGVFDALK